MSQQIVLNLTNESYLIKKAYKYVIYNNESNFLPYHNLSHLLNVAGWSYEILKSVDATDIHRQYLMIVAGLFHDFNHSGGKEKDDHINIKYALAGFDNFIKDSNFAVPEFSDEDYKFIQTIIKYTKFPHESILEEDKEFELYIGIIRDADLLQMTCDSYVPHVVLGLSKESNISIEDMIKSQSKFIDSIKWNIPIVAELFNKFWYNLLKQNSEYLEKLYV